MKTRGFSAALVAFLVLASACSGGDDPVGAQTGGGSSDRLEGAFAAGGITVIDDPATSTGSGMELWSFQAENMAREIEDGAGFLGSELDELVGSPGGMPFSYLLAGWLSSGATPTAEEAVALMGDQPWEQAPSIVYPSAVLLLFVADGIQATGALDAGTATARAQLASFAQGGVCSALSSWFNSALDFIFESLKVEIDGDGGFFDWLGIVWNAALDLARGLIEGLAETLLAPIITLVAPALAIIGTVSMIASVLQPWNLDLEPSNPVTRFALTGAPNVQESVVATADPGYEFEWPDSVEDCASVAGLELPNPTDAEGSGVEWRQIGFPQFGSATEVGRMIDDENEATLEWVTAREESDEGDELAGTVSIRAAVELKQIDEMKSMLAGLIAGAVPDGLLEDVVRAAFSELTAPIFEALTDLVRIKGTTSVTVIYHDDPDEPETTIVPGTASCVVGTFTANGSDAAAIYAQSLGIAAQEPYSEGTVTARFSDDGTVEFDFSNWIIGNRTYTESPIEGVIADLTGDTFTQSNGRASGTWSVTGDRLTMNISFQTSVVQRLISPELEIDSTIDAIPDFARLYIIPSGATRFVCDESFLGIEWEDGMGVRWLRAR